MSKYRMLLRISAFAFSMLPIGIAVENNLALAIIAVGTLLPLLIYAVAAIYVTSKTKTPFVTNLLGFGYTNLDAVIACLGIINCLFLGLYKISIIWILSLVFVLLGRKVSRRRR